MKTSGKTSEIARAKALLKSLKAAKRAEKSVKSDGYTIFAKNLLRAQVTNERKRELAKLNEVIEREECGVWQLTDEHDLIFTAVSSDAGMTVSEIFYDAEDAIYGKPEVTESLIETLEEQQYLVK